MIKEVKSMKTRIFRSSVLFLAAAVMFLMTANINAQERKHNKKRVVKKEVIVKHPVRHKEIVRHPVKHREVVVRKTENYREVIVKNRHYFYRDGYFYNRGHEGYVKVVAPLGARISMLPHGYKIVRVHRKRYYLFGGIYYRFIPRERVYVVVKTPL